MANALRKTRIVAFILALIEIGLFATGIALYLYDIPSGIQAAIKPQFWAFGAGVVAFANIVAVAIIIAHISRIRQKGIKLTVCVDKVAASGGYMMACIGSRIISAPFAVIGSIGVVAEFPNFNRLLKKLNVDYEQETAGEYKRTLSMLGDNSDPKAREKFRQELEECHQLFKNHVSKYRPQIDINEIATGEHWFGVDAVKKHLVDDISTSDDYILTKIENSNNQVYEFVEKEPKKSLLKKLISGAYHGVIGSNKVM